MCDCVKTYWLCYTKEAHYSVRGGDEKARRKKGFVDLMRRKVLTRLARDPGLLTYHAGAIFLSPMLLKRKWRLSRVIGMDCEFDITRWKARFEPHTAIPESAKQEGTAVEKKTGPRVMFVTYGLGEVITMEPLVQALRAEIPDMHIMFTVKHREALPGARRLSDEEILPLPFDHMVPVARWIERSRPDIVVFYEHFHVPTVLHGLSLTNIPFVIIHARMQRGISESKRRVAYQRWQLQGIQDICFSSATHLPPAQQLLPRKAKPYVTGSIKFPLRQNQLPPQREAELKSWIETNCGEAPLIVAGSTHKNEEAFVLDALDYIAKEGDLTAAPRVLLAPRDPRRSDEVAELVSSRGLSLSRRSQFAPQAQTTPCDVLLLDTLGELSSVYKFGVGSFVGGTVNGSSHNVTEPLMWGTPVAYGLTRGNFAIEQQMCEECGVGFRVSSPQELGAHWSELLRSPEMQQSIRVKAKELVVSQSNAFGDTLKVLINSINSTRTGATPHPNNVLTPESQTA